jgi:hypothetical protein
MLDFKLVACAGKPLLKLENLRRLSLSVATQPQTGKLRTAAAGSEPEEPRREAACEAGQAANSASSKRQSTS